jgi:hypothetical protein
VEVVELLGDTGEDGGERLLQRRPVVPNEQDRVAESHLEGEEGRDEFLEALRDHLAGEERDPALRFPDPQGYRPAVNGGTIDLEDVGAQAGAEVKEPFLAEDLPADESLDAVEGEGRLGELEAVTLEEDPDVPLLPVKVESEEGDRRGKIEANRLALGGREGP